MSSENNKLQESRGITFKDLIAEIEDWKNYLLSKWIIILLIGIVGGSLGYVYAYFNKPLYTATTTFVLEDDKGSTSMGGLGGLASIAGIDLGGAGGGIFQGDNLLELYKSRTMIEKTLLSHLEADSGQLLIDRYIQFSNLKEQWKKTPSLSNIAFSDSLNASNRSRLQDSLLGNIVNDINLNYLNVSKPDKKLSIIRVNVTAQDELFAKSFNDRIVENVNDFYTQTKTKKTQDNISILQHKTDSVRAAMVGAIYSAAAITDATPNLNPTRQIQRVVPVQKSQFSAETNKAMLSSLLQNLEMSKMTLLRETPLIQVVDQPVYPLEVKRFGKLKGIIFGGIIAGVVIVLFLIFKRLISKALI